MDGKSSLVRCKFCNSYAAFQHIGALLRELSGRKDNQAYFWTEQWQKRIRDAEADISSGRTYRVTPQNVGKALEWLDVGILY